MSTNDGSYTWPAPEGETILDEDRRHYVVHEPDGASVFFFGSAEDLCIAVPTELLRASLKMEP